MKIIYLIFGALSLAHYANAIQTKISKGIHYEKLEHKTFYESSLPLIYEVERPNLIKPGQNNTLRKTAFEISFNKLLNEGFEIFSKFIPIDYEVNENAHSIGRRSIEFIGQFSSWCCGVATEKALDDLAKSESDVENFVGKLQAQLAKSEANNIKSTKLLNSYSASLDVVIEGIENKTTHDLKVLSNREEALAASLKENTKLLARMADTWLQSIVANQWMKIADNCRNGLIPESLIGKQILKSDIYNMTLNLRKKGMALAIGENELNKYYHLPIVSCSFTSKKLVVVVKIPILKVNQNYGIVKFTNLPFLSDSHICHVQDQPKYALMKGNKIISMSSTIEQTCKSELCHISRFASAVDHRSKCTEEILNPTSTVSELKENCKLTCFKPKDDKTVITEAAHNDFVVINQKNQILIKCEGQKDLVLNQIVGSGMHRVVLPCGCVIKGIDTYVESTFPCSSKIESEAMVHHVILGHWTRIDSSVINDNNVFGNQTEIFNPNWHLTVPHLNLTVPEEDNSFFIPHIRTIADHFSLIIPIWLGVLTSLNIYILCKVTKTPYPISVIPIARADTGEIIINSIDDILLLLILITLWIVLVYAKGNAMRKMKYKREVSFLTNGPINVKVSEPAKKASTSTSVV